MTLHFPTQKSSVSRFGNLLSDLNIVLRHLCEQVSSLIDSRFRPHDVHYIQVNRSALDCCPYIGGASDKEPACQCKRHKRCRFDPWVQKIPQRRKWQPTPVFLPRESHGQRTLVVYIPWVTKSRTQLNQLSTHICCQHISQNTKLA